MASLGAWPNWVKHLEKCGVIDDLTLLHHRNAFDAYFKKKGLLSF